MNDRLSHGDNEVPPWIDPNDDLPNNFNIVEVITIDDYITVAQFHKGIIKVLPDGSGLIKQHPQFGFVNPDDLNLKTTIKAWRIII